MTNRELMERDLRHIWHPCTQMKDHETLPLIPIKRGEGVWLYDFDGRRYLDAISSWWVNLFGHANPHISEAVSRQARQLEHVLLAGFTHAPAVELAEKLAHLTPRGLEKVFFADNGSSAVEVALKMSYHAHRNRGEERSLFLSLSNSYHGETLGALSVGDVELYKETYEPLLIRNIQTPVPRDTSPEASREALKALEALLAERGKEISAFIVEPLVQGAGGMHMYGAEYLRGARELTRKYGVHLIADEIMTGFGRTGTMFACEQAGITPDFMTLSKGLTGGYLPLSVVMTLDEIYGLFYCDYSEYKAFLHSHSYTGNPLACAAALATLELFERENTLEVNHTKARRMAQNLQRFLELDTVKSIRQTGMIAAVEMIDYPAQERKGLEVYRYGLEHEVLLRPLGNVIYFMPPYVITEEQIDLMMEVAYEGMKSVGRGAL
ncbi:adenosylmethionine--8-amino-7-oxononanoate transaminase [Nitratifractor salsuginis]|uniref:Adenosylmethionine-8-amino-7-oxononanoate aminotransferase n=1 Tax=Nitratifractor salsuginis (strain DSM 16511 / JCM 12458 / E9I37-1) TaxID=749222 RepID=E6WZP7_NITSE|nr:adenosylmethionine--8-amino-7-oxononanoate transaminase [Nitratifractor salsuginis]ADV46688.1 adenosylmethionine-8-amino-7-oxononanoate aminotransferase apoenzyme [Nitratifractor salsuginis DSM 16511]